MKLISISLAIGILLATACKNNEKNEHEKIGFSGTDLSSLASISRDKETKKASFETSLNEQWVLYSGLSPDSIDFSKPLLSGKTAGTYTLDVQVNKRYYFEVVTKESSAALAERHLPMSGGFNFRDLGGYKTKEGKFVKWGKIIRSDDLSKLTDADLEYLSSMPLLTDIDYRSVEEIKPSPDKRPQSLLNYLEYNISPGNTDAMMAKLKTATSAAIDSEMMAMNVFFVSNDEATIQYHKMFELLQNPKRNVPLLYHCTAGKDRTGMASALILYALGADDKTVMDDYLLSNKYIEAKFASYIKQYPNLLGLFSVKEEYLQAGLDAINKNYGNVDNFLTKKLKVDINKMRDLYLYK